MARKHTARNRSFCQGNNAPTCAVAVVIYTRPRMLFSVLPRTLRHFRACSTHMAPGRRKYKPKRPFRRRLTRKAPGWAVGDALHRAASEGSGWLGRRSELRTSVVRLVSAPCARRAAISALAALSSAQRRRISLESKLGSSMKAFSS